MEIFVVGDRFTIFAEVEKIHQYRKETEVCTILQKR